MLYKNNPFAPWVVYDLVAQILLVHYACHPYIIVKMGSKSILWEKNLTKTAILYFVNTNDQDSERRWSKSMYDFL